MSGRAAADATAGNLRPAFDSIAQRIGMKLRDVYGSPEADPLPAQHVELLLRLRHKERDQSRLRGR